MLLNYFVITLISLGHYLPLLSGDDWKLSIIYLIDFFRKRQRIFPQNFQNRPYFKLQFHIPFLIIHESLAHTLRKSKLKTFHKIFKLILIPKIIASRVKSINIYVMADGQGSQSAGDTIFAGQVMVIVEMIDDLAIF